MPHLGGYHQNIVIMFVTEKLEWCGYPTVKKYEDITSHFDTIHERHEQQQERQTDRHHTTA